MSLRKKLTLRAILLGFNLIMTLAKSAIIHVVYCFCIHYFPLTFYNLPKNVTFGEVFLIVALLTITIDWNPIETEIELMSPEENEINIFLEEGDDDDISKS